MPDIIEEQLMARVEWCCADPSRDCCEEARAALRAYRELIGQDPPGTSNAPPAAVSGPDGD